VRPLDYSKERLCHFTQSFLGPSALLYFSLLFSSQRSPTSAAMRRELILLTHPDQPRQLLSTRLLSFFTMPLLQRRNSSQCCRRQIRSWLNRITQPGPKNANNRGIKYPTSFT